MDVVAEIDIVRDPGDAAPIDRPVLGEALPDGREHVGVGPQLRMAGYADVGRREAGVRGGLDRRVAVAAVDSEIARTMLVAERHRLKRRPVGDVPILRSGEGEGDDEKAERNDESPERNRPEPGVRRS